MTGSNGNGDPRLDSWKEIAAYLRRDERTAIRWEKERGLPIHRVPGGQRKAVFAYADELDSWLRREERPASPATAASVAPAEVQVVPEPFSPLSPRGTTSRSTRLTYLVAAAAVVAGTMLLFSIQRPRSFAISPQALPVRIDFTLDGLQAFDDRGGVLWTHKFSGTLAPEKLSTQRSLVSYSHIGDFTGRGDREILVVAPLQDQLNPRSSAQSEVDLFSSRGELLWSYVPHGRFQFGTHELTGPWNVTDLFVSRHGDKNVIWVAVGQVVWGNSFVVNLDPVTGKDSLRFVNTGSVRALNEVSTTRGTFLLVGGFNNEPDAGSLQVFDEAKPFATTPQTEGTRHKCSSCPPGDPDFYFVFPRSELNELAQSHPNVFVEISVNDDQIEMRKNEGPTDGTPQTLYYLTANESFRAESVRFESGYDALHRRLEQEGKIGHRLEFCPERLHPRPIRMWTPTEGWRLIQLPPSGANQ